MQEYTLTGLETVTPPALQVAPGGEVPGQAGDYAGLSMAAPASEAPMEAREAQPRALLDTPPFIGERQATLSPPSGEYAARVQKGDTAIHDEIQNQVLAGVAMAREQQHADAMREKNRAEAQWRELEKTRSASSLQAIRDDPREAYWSRILTGDLATIPDDVRQKIGAPDADEREVALAINRSWAVDHMGLTREQVRTGWSDIRSRLAKRLGTEEDERDVFDALSHEQQDMKPIRETVRRTDHLCYERGFDGEGLPAELDLDALPSVYRHALAEVARRSHLEGAAERQRLMPTADLVWKGMKALLPEEVPLDEEEKPTSFTDDSIKLATRIMTSTPSGIDQKRMALAMPDLFEAAGRLSGMSSEDRRKVYRLLQKRVPEDKKKGMLEAALRNFQRGAQDVTWGLVQAGGNALAVGAKALGGESGTLLGWDARKTSENIDGRFRMIEEMKRAVEGEILPLQLDEHASFVEKTVVDSARAVAPALLALCGGAGFGTLLASGAGESMAAQRQNAPGGNETLQGAAALAEGAFDALANYGLGKIGAGILRRSVTRFAAEYATATPAQALLGAAKATGAAGLKETGLLFGFGKVSALGHMGLQEGAARLGDYDSGVNWKGWGESQFDLEAQRREAAAILPYLLIGSGRVGLRYFQSVPAVLGNGARLKAWGIPDEDIRSILKERDRERQGEMLRQALVRSPKWGGVDFIHQATQVLNLLRPVPGYIFKTDGAVRDFLNLPADYKPMKRPRSRVLTDAETREAQARYGLIGDPAACKKALRLWDDWWNRGGLTVLMKDEKGARNLDACGVALLLREQRNLEELAAPPNQVRKLLPERLREEGVFQPNAIEDARVLLYDRMREVRQRPFRLLMSRESIDGIQLSGKSAEFWKREGQQVDERMRTIVYEGVMRLWRGEEKNRVIADVGRSVWKLWSRSASAPDWRASAWLEREKLAAGSEAANEKLPIEERLLAFSEHVREKGEQALGELTPEMRQACRMVWGTQADVRMLLSLLPMQRDFDVAMSRGFTPEEACAYLLQRELDIRPETLAKRAEYLPASATLKPLQERKNALLRVEAAYERFARMRGIEPACVTGEDGCNYWSTLYPNGMPTRWHASREDMLADWGAHVAGLFAPAGESRQQLLAKWQNGSEIVDESFELYKGLRDKRKMSVFDELAVKASHDLMNKWYGGFRFRLPGESVGKPMNYRKMREDVREVLRPLARVTVKNGGLMGREHDPLTLDNPVALIQGKADTVWHRLLNTRILSSAEAVELLKSGGMAVDEEHLADPANRHELVFALTELTKRYYMDHLDDPSVPPSLSSWLRYAVTDMPASLDELTRERIEVEKELPANPSGLASRPRLIKWSTRGAVAEVQRLSESAGTVADAERRGAIAPHLLGMLRDSAGMNRGVQAERAWMNERFRGRNDVFSVMDRLVHLLPSNRLAENVPAINKKRLRDTLSYVTSFFGLLKPNDKTMHEPWSERSLVRLQVLADVLRDYPDLHEWSIDRRTPGRFRRIVGETYAPGWSRTYVPERPLHYRSEPPERHKDYRIADNCMLPDAMAADPRVESAIRTLDALRRYSARVPASTAEGVAWGGRLYDKTGENRPRGIGQDWEVTQPMRASSGLLRAMKGTHEAFGIKLLKLGKDRVMRQALDLMIVYRDPNLPGHTVRLMPGFPDASNPRARGPYVVHAYKGVYLDEKGNPLSPGKLHRSYIPLEKLRLRPLEPATLGDVEAAGKFNLLWNLRWASRRSKVHGKTDAANSIVPNPLELMIRLEDELGQGQRWQHGQLERLTPRDMHLLKASRLLQMQPDIMFMNHADNAHGLHLLLNELSRSYWHMREEMGLSGELTRKNAAGGKTSGRTKPKNHGNEPEEP